MKDLFIKVTFDTSFDESPVRFDTFEEAIVRRIGERKNSSVPVFIQNPMPMSEFYAIISEVCERIRYNTDYKISFIPLECNLIKDAENVANMASFCIQVNPENVFC